MRRRCYTARPMRTRRHIGELLGVAAIVLSLTFVALLQYRWVEQLATAERERLRTSLERAGLRFADDLEREVISLLRTFGSLFARGHGDSTASRQRGNRDPSDKELGSLLEENLRARWQELLDQSAHADLVVALHVAAPGGAWRRLPGPTASWQPGAPPQVLARRPNTGRRQQFGLVDQAHHAALLLPILPRRARRAPPMPPPPAGVGGLLVVVLDPERLRGLLEHLAEHHFGPAEERNAALRIFRRPEGSEVFRSPQGGPLDFRRPDFEVPLLAREGIDAIGDPDPRPPGPFPGGGRTRSRGGESPWVLQLVHEAGSLEAAVARTRRSQLALAAVTLLLLSATVAWLITSARRARYLAHQRIDFVAGLTHELHTPLAAIRSAGEKLAAGVVSEPPRLRQYGELLVREGRRLQALVGQALDLAGMARDEAALEPRPLDVRGALESAVRDAEWLRSEHGAGVRLEVEPDLPAVLADPLARSRVRANLIANGIKHGRAGGQLTLRARRITGGRVAIEVEDQGPGIHQAELAHIFEPFYRGRAARERTLWGSGLGLALVRRLVERSGGAVSVENTGGGALFRVVLPAGGA